MIKSFDRVRFQRFAKQFADIYINSGEDAAGFFTVNQLPRMEDRETVRPYIREEFESRDYTFSLLEDIG